MSKVTQIASRAWRGWTDTGSGVLFRELVRARGVVIGHKVRIIGRPLVELAPGSAISIGDRSMLISRVASTALGVSRPVILRTLDSEARITIGSDSGLSGTTICAMCSVAVGARVLFGADVLVTDTDFHEIDSVPRRYAPPPAPSDSDRVVIGDDVFVGARSIILSGSRIGSGSVIGAGSVVKGTVPPLVVAAGNPCRVIRPLSNQAP